MVLGYKRTCWRYYVNSEGLREEIGKNTIGLVIVIPLKGTVRGMVLRLKKILLRIRRVGYKIMNFLEQGVLLKPCSMQ